MNEKRSKHALLDCIKTLALTSTTLIAVASASSSVLAHVVLEKREAAVGSYYKAVFQVAHGCEGSPTVGLEVTIPD